MFKAKFFKEQVQYNLDKAVNDFIKDKNVVNISFSVAQCGYSYIHCCCVLYNE